jgi:short-subunit dehydrogenase involved in D-alanine esterification of teichoic acids
MSNNIEGKVVVITGASSGLGAAAARHLASLGATVVLGARRVDRIQALAKELIARGSQALAVETDVTQFDQVQRLWCRHPLLVTFCTSQAVICTFQSVTSDGKFVSRCWMNLNNQVNH